MPASAAAIRAPASGPVAARSSHHAYASAEDTPNANGFTTHVVDCTNTGDTRSPRPSAYAGSPRSSAGTSEPIARRQSSEAVATPADGPELVEQQQGRGGVGRTAAEAGGDRDALVDGDPGAGWSRAAGLGGQRASGSERRCSSRRWGRLRRRAPRAKASTPSAGSTVTSSASEIGQHERLDVVVAVVATPRAPGGRRSVSRAPPSGATGHAVGAPRTDARQTAAPPRSARSPRARVSRLAPTGRLRLPPGARPRPRRPRRAVGARSASSSAARRTRRPPPPTVAPRRRRPAVLQALEADDHRLDLGPRPEHGRRHAAHERPLRPGRRPATLGIPYAFSPGAADQSLPHLPLHHHDEPAHLWARARRVSKHQVASRRCREVGGEDPLVLAERVPPLAIRRIRVQARGRDPSPPPIPSSAGIERWIHLDGEHLGAGLGERSRERAEAGADLDHAIAGTDAGIGRDRAGEVRIDQEMLSERSLRPDAVPLGERTQRASAERAGRSSRFTARSVARSETVRSRADGPGPNVKGGAGWCADDVSVGHDPHGREELLGRIRVRRALAHLPRTREPARTRPRMSRRFRRRPKSRRRGSCASDRASPLRPPPSPPHPSRRRFGDDITRRNRLFPSSRRSERHPSVVPFLEAPGEPPPGLEAVVETAR